MASRAALPPTLAALACLACGGGAREAPPDTTPPTPPSGLTAVAVSATRVDVAWSAATDDTGVAAYDLQRDGAVIWSGVGLALVDTGVTPSATFCYAVRARDAFGNASGYTAPACVTTPPAADTTPPTAQAAAPLPGAQGVGVDAVVAAALSEPIDPGTLTSATFGLLGPSGPVAGTVAWDGSTLTATFTPAAPLEWLASYTATLGQGVTDLAGNPLAAPLSWGFATALRPIVLAAAGSVPLGFDASALALGDLDGDGRLDLVAAEYGGAGRVLLGDGAGGFAGTTTFAAGDGPRAIAVADLDLDGAPDLAVADDAWHGLPLTPGGVTVLPGDGTGGLGPGATLAVGPFPLDLVVADLDGDGVPDLATPAWLGAGDVSVLLGDGAGGFAPALLVPALTSASIEAGDFDEDGHLDLAPSGGPLLLGAGTGSFAAGQPIGFGEPMDLAAADLDGDGHLDLVAAMDGSDYLLVAWGDGAGGLSVPQVVTVERYPRGVKVADLNGDGRPDLVVATQMNGGIGANAAWVVPGLGGRAFGPAQLAFQAGGLGISPPLLAVGDVNGDGRPDLLASQASFQQAVTVLLDAGP